MKTTTFETSRRLSNAINQGKLPVIESDFWILRHENGDVSVVGSFEYNNAPLHNVVDENATWTLDELWDALPTSIIQGRSEYRKRVSRHGFVGYESAGHLELDHPSFISFTPDGLVLLLLWLADNHPESLTSK